MDGRVYRFADRAALASAVAERLDAETARVQAIQPLAQLCLSGGGTARAVYEELARLAPRSRVDVSRIELWWSDEAWSPTTEENRNAGHLLALLGGVYPLNRARIHAMPARTSIDADVAALQYAAELGRTHFDVCLLSMGSRGQIAALFDADVDPSATVIALHDAPLAPRERLSITYRAINASREVWVMASGADKADAVAATLTGPGTTTPASRVAGRRATRWFVDAAAGAKLPRYDCGW